MSPRPKVFFANTLYPARNWGRCFDLRGLPEFGQRGKLASRRITNNVCQKNFYTEFKVKVALAALTRDKPIEELCSEFDVHLTQINKWKRELKAGAAEIFNGTEIFNQQMPELCAKSGQLAVESVSLADDWEKR